MTRIIFPARSYYWGRGGEGVYHVWFDFVIHSFFETVDTGGTLPDGKVVKT